MGRPTERTVLLDVLTIAPEAIPGAEEDAVLLADVLLESVIDVNEHGYPGYTPLHMAIAQNDASAVEFLISRGADPEIPTKTDAGNGLNAHEFVDLLENTIPGIDRTKVANILRNDT